jgi:serine/threonine-protein kinase
MLPEKFGRYEVLGELGDGAMGRVYRAFDPVVRRTVAVKTIKSEYLTREEAPEYLKRFRREAQAAGILNHPAIVSIFDVGEDFLVMEFLEGKTLYAHLQDKGQLDPAECLRILSPLAEALDHAHRSGIFHRDIKPANIMVLSDGRAKLMDFGVAHLEASVMTTAGQIFGSPSYMSPEQVAGHDVTSRSDLYSLAVVGYEALTGQRPFQGTSLTSIIYKVMSEVPAPPRQWNRDLPERYDDVFERALAKDPGRRYPTATEFVAALDLKEFDQALLQAAVAPAAIATIATTSASVAKAAAAERKKEPVSVGTSDTETLAGDDVAARLARDGAARPASGPDRRMVLGIGAVAVLGALAFVYLRPSGEPVDALRVAATAPPTLPSAPPAASAAPVPAGTPIPVAPEPAASATPRAAKVRAKVEPTPEPTLAPVVAAPVLPIEGALVEMDASVTPPVKLSGASAPYPDKARRGKIYGTVAVSMIINAHGEPTELGIAESAGDVLDEAVVAAVRTWRFTPAVKDGVKVSVRWLVRQRFQKGP